MAIELFQITAIKCGQKTNKLAQFTNVVGSRANLPASKILKFERFLSESIICLEMGDKWKTGKCH